MKKKALTVFGILFFSLSLIVSCANQVSSDSSCENSHYGTLKISTSQTQDSRVFDTAQIENAVISVYGSQMEPVYAKASCKDGKGTFKIENIPVGKNRIVTVQAQKTVGSILSNIDGIVMSAVCDIEPGDSNSVSVNWKSTSLGNVCLSLYKLDYNLSSLNLSEVSSLLPQDVHALLIDTGKIASDIKNGTKNPSDSYKLSGGTVKFSSDLADSSISVHVNDVVSQKIALSSGEQTISGVAPGTWTFYIIKEAVVLYENEVTVQDNQTVDLGKIEFTIPTLGFMHPSSGKFSPVEEESWAQGTWDYGAVSDGSTTTFALYSKNAQKVLLEIYNASYGKDSQYDYWLVKDSNDVWRAKISGDLNGSIYAFRCWGPNWEYSDEWQRGGSSIGFISDCDSNGNRFNPNKVVFDPYAKEITHDPS
ncbi:MAG: hypothetical protein MR937_03280, partial [Spirochaetia bacterium]|nr:hypothetical protein [Spirochaetia bacterium]